MRKFKPGEAAQLLDVSVDTVRRWCDDGRLRTTRGAGGQRLIDPAALARFVSEQAQRGEPESVMPQSARNRFTGLVTRVVKDKVTAQVELRCGPFRVVSLMTREAADDLELAPGVLAVAAVKSTNVIVELPSD